MRPAPLVLLAALFATPLAHAGFDEGVLAFENEDYPAALRQFTPLAKAGNAAAMNYLARTYDEGMDAPEDAFPWYLRAAQKGDADAQARLAEMYDEGEGVEQDQAKAMEWYAKAAAQGDDDSQLALGEHAENDLADNAGAARWYEKAAEQGNAEAQYRLGLLLLADDGVKRDVPRAWMFLSLAADGDEEDAAQALGVLELEMEPSEMKQARALLAQWRRAHE